MKANKNPGCAILLVIMSLAFLLYLFFKSDPEIELRNKSATEWRINYRKNFNYNPDLIGLKFKNTFQYTTNNLILKGKCIIVNKNDNMKFDYSMTNSLTKKLIAFKENDLKIVVIYNYINGVENYENGYEVSYDSVELEYVDVKTSSILKTDLIFGDNTIVSNSRRSHTKHTEVSLDKVILTIEKNLN